MVRPIILFFILACTTSTGCAFLEKRANDFGDCFKASVGYGLGIESHIQVGPVTLGAGAWIGNSLGWEGKKVQGDWAEYFVGVPVLQILGTLVLVINGMNTPGWALLGLISTGYEDLHIHEDEVGSTCIHYGHGAVLGLPFFGVSSPYETLSDQYARYQWTEYFWIAFGVRCFAGLKFGFNLAEFADFLLGFFGLDICGDDDREADRAALLESIRIDHFKRRLLDKDVSSERLAFLREEIGKIEALAESRTLADYRRIAEKLRHEDPEIRYAAAKALFQCPPDSEVVEALNRVLNDPVPEIRKTAKNVLSRMER
ncbi:MAG: HEAT repeat domain-containing protein [Planctomycetota bacterium]|jgi:hypothetical protein